MSMCLYCTVHGKILEGEIFGESLLMKQLVRKILANLLTIYQLFHCIYLFTLARKIWRIVYHLPNSPKFPPPKFSHIWYTIVRSTLCTLAVVVKYIDVLAYRFEVYFKHIWASVSTTSGVAYRSIWTFS